MDKEINKKNCDNCTHQKEYVSKTTGETSLVCDRFNCKFESKLDELLEKAYKAGWRDSCITYDFKGAKERNFED